MIVKDVGITVVCFHKNIYVPRKSHDIGIAYQNGHFTLIISQTSLFHLQTRLLYNAKAYRDNISQ